MEGFVAKHVHDYQTGKISRRRLIEILTLAATSAGAGRVAGAEPTGLDVALVNHVSYTCPDFRKAADWYSKVFNLDQVGATDHDVALPFGKKSEKPRGRRQRRAADPHHLPHPAARCAGRQRAAAAYPEGGDRSHRVYGRRLRPRARQSAVRRRRRYERARWRTVQRLCGGPVRL